jgi:hypothetical protein
VREVVALRFLSLASRERTKAHLPYCGADQKRDTTNKNCLYTIENRYPLANTSFLQPVVLYYARAVRTALSPIEGLKPIFTHEEVSAAHQSEQH